MSGTSNRIPALHPDLLDDPLAYLTASQKCERKMLRLLDGVVGGEREWSATAREIINYLSSERAYCTADLTEDLHPILLEACEPEDDLEEVLERIEAQSSEIAKILEYIVDQLTHCIATDAPPKENDLLYAVVSRFGRIARQNVMLENAIVLPFAGKRLNKADIAKLSQRMRQRRALPGPK